MKDNYHKTGALILWGERGFLETGVEAQLSDDGDSKGVEASFGIRSSLDRLPGFKVTARTEMQSRILDSSLIFQVVLLHEVIIICSPSSRFSHTLF